MTRVLIFVALTIVGIFALPHPQFSDDDWNAIETPVEESLSNVIPKSFSDLEEENAAEDCVDDVEAPAEVEIDEMELKFEVTEPPFIPTEAEPTTAPECGDPLTSAEPEMKVDSSCEMEWGDWSSCVNNLHSMITCGEEGVKTRVRECDCELLTMGLREDGEPKTCEDFELIQQLPCDAPCKATTTPLPPTTPEAPKGCKEKAVDIIFVLDGSSSVGPRNFTVAQNFINGIVDEFNVSPQGVQIGLLQYSTAPRIEFNLGAQKTKEAVKGAVKNVEWILGDTHTAYALRETYNSMVLPAQSKTKGRSRFVIVITDGDPQDFKQVPAAVKKLASADVKIFAVGVGDATVPELKKLGHTGNKSDDKDFFYADDYESAKSFTDTLVKLVCKNV